MAFVFLLGFVVHGFSFLFFQNSDLLTYFDGFLLFLDDLCEFLDFPVPMGPGPKKGCYYF